MFFPFSESFFIWLSKTFFYFVLLTPTFITYIPSVCTFLHLVLLVVTFVAIIFIFLAFSWFTLEMFYVFALKKKQKSVHQFQKPLRKK